MTYIKNSPRGEFLVLCLASIFSEVIGTPTGSAGRQRRYILITCNEGFRSAET